MSRDIKFRAWDNKEKKWLMGYEYPNLGGFSMFGECMLMEEWSGILNRFILQQKDRTPEDLILMQYTGLFDKNLKDIYEGDVIRYKIKKSIVTCEVAFIKYGWYPFFDKAYMIDEADWIEVIGNIYQNPGLLTPTK